jgi:RNA polymerase sigma-70 factor (ECF subfamily)
MARYPTDEELLLTPDGEAFGVFYARYRAQVEVYFGRRVRQEAAADLAAETFVSALVARRRFVAGGPPAAAWLFTIASRRLVDFRRRQSTQQRTLTALARDTAVGPRNADDSPAPVDPDLEAGLLRHLPLDQRDAIMAHIIDELEYGEVASHLNASEATIRQRVSRGLGELRRAMLVYRAATAFAPQERLYRFGGGHHVNLESIRPEDPLDCSASASLILRQAGLFESEAAWTSRQLATSWGRPGEGRYVTVWADERHVWMEFNLEAEHGQQFDPTPSRIGSGTAAMPLPISPRTGAPRHWPGL